MIRYALIAALVAGPAVAQDFDAFAWEEGSEAKTWNLYAEVPARFEAKVVDPLCELAGQCADNCGDGRRQLALLRASDDAMVLVLKNSQAAFTGGAEELLPYCGQQVEVDGLLLEDPDLGARNMYLVQRIRAVGAEDWVKGNSWTKAWAKKHPEAKGKGPWFRRDPRIAAEVAAEGWLGLGAEADAAFIQEEYGE